MRLPQLEPVERRALRVVIQDGGRDVVRGKIARQATVVLPAPPFGLITNVVFVFIAPPPA
jgi:hypothetical protein